MVAACGAGSDGDSQSVGSSASEHVAKTEERDSISDKLSKYIPQGVKDLAGMASTAMSVYSGVKSALDVLTSLGRALGFLDTPVPIDQQIAALQADVDAQAGTLSWQLSQQERQTRMATLKAALDHLHMLQIQGKPVDTTSAGVYESHEAVYDAEIYNVQNTAFLHLFKSSFYSDSYWNILGRPSAAPSDEVYDWRVGVPELMQLINLRLQIIATADPDFRQDNAFHDEFVQHLQTLQAHFQKMVDGVRCAPVNYTWRYTDSQEGWESIQLGYKCGDTATGIIIDGATDAVDEPICPVSCDEQGCSDPDPNCPDVQEYNYLYTKQLVPGMAELRQRLLGAMPLAEMQQMMSTLWTYANPGSDEQPLAASSWGGYRIDAFYRDSAGALRHKARDDSGWWEATENLGGQILGAPSAVSWGYDRLDVFVRGTDDAVYHQWGTSAGFPNGYEALGGQIVDSPHAVSWGSGRLDVFVNGTGRQLFDQAWDAVAQPWWWGWWMIGGGDVGTPAPVASAPNRLDIFATGLDGSLQHASWDGAQWNTPESLGGTLSTRPAAVSWGPGRLDVFALGTDHALYHKSSSGSGFSDWEYLGGPFTSAPSAVSWGPGRLDVFVRGTDGALWHNWFDASRGSTWGGFESLGGWIQGAPVAVAPTANWLEVLVVDANGGLEERYWDGWQWLGYVYLGDGVTVAP